MNQFKASLGMDRVAWTVGQTEGIAAHLKHVLAGDGALGGREGARNRAEARSVRPVGTGEGTADKVVADEELEGVRLEVDPMERVILAKMRDCQIRVRDERPVAKRRENSPRSAARMSRG